MKIPRKNKERINPTEGSHIGRLIRIVDMGTQHSEKFGSDRRKIMLTFELGDEKAVFDEEKGEQPFVIGREFTMLLTPKSGLRKFLLSWVGSKVDDEEFDISDYLNKPCQISVVLDSNNDENIEYANLYSVKPIKKGVKVPKAENPILEFDLDNFDEEVYEQLHDWEKEKISGSPEFQELDSTESETEAVETEEVEDLFGEESDDD